MNNNDTTAQIVRKQARRILNLQSTIRSLQEQLNIERQLHQLTKQDLKQTQERLENILNNPQSLGARNEVIVWRNTALQTLHWKANCTGHLTLPWNE